MTKGKRLLDVLADELPPSSYCDRHYELTASAAAGCPACAVEEHARRAQLLLEVLHCVEAFLERFDAPFDTCSEAELRNGARALLNRVAVTRDLCSGDV